MHHEGRQPTVGLELPILGELAVRLLLGKVRRHVSPHGHQQVAVLVGEFERRRRPRQYDKPRKRCALGDRRDNAHRRVAVQPRWQLNVVVGCRRAAILIQVDDPAAALHELHHVGTLAHVGRQRDLFPGVAPGGRGAELAARFVRDEQQRLRACKHLCQRLQGAQLHVLGRRRREGMHETQPLHAIIIFVAVEMLADEDAQPTTEHRGPQEAHQHRSSPEQEEELQRLTPGAAYKAYVVAARRHGA